MLRTMMLTVLSVVSCLIVAWASEPWTNGTPDRDDLYTMEYGQDTNMLVNPAAGLDISGVSVLQANEYPSVDSLSDVEVWMIAGMQSPRQISSYQPELQSYFDTVKGELKRFITKRGYVPARFDDVLAEFPCQSDNPEHDNADDQCFRNPFTGDYPYLAASYLSPGDFYVCLLDSNTIQQYAELDPAFNEMYYCGQRTVRDSNLDIVDISPVQITCQPFYIRMYGSNAALRDDIIWSWEYTDPARQQQWRTTGQ